MSDSKLRKHSNKQIKTSSTIAGLLGTLLFASTVLFSRTVSASCTTSDYKNIVGSQYTKTMALYAAPNSQSDILVAGNYYEEDNLDIFRMYVYLFSESTCSYLWTYNLSKDTDSMYVRGLTWSYDESKAYMVAYSSVNSDEGLKTEYLVVFNSPYKSGDAKPYVYGSLLAAESFYGYILDNLSIYAQPGIWS